jgi:hypothetical protein
LAGHGLRVSLRLGGVLEKTAGGISGFGGPPLPRGYLGRKILIFNGLQRVGVCKIFKINGLCANSPISMS